jgi:O-antigen ligase
MFLAQSMLTFSRTGFYLALVSALVSAAFFIRQKGQRLTLLLAGAVAFAAVSYVIFPKLDAFTGGKLATRFQETDLTGREQIFWQEIETFQQHPFFGVGPGRSAYARITHSTRSHTEFSRLLAEHGMFGLVAFLLLLVMIRRALRQTPENRHRARVASFTAWAVLFMCVSGMRLVVPAFLFGLALAPCETDEEEHWQSR